VKINFSNSTRDYFLWTTSSNDSIASSSTYKLIRSNDYFSLHPSLSFVSWKQPWKLNLSDRCKLFLWKLDWNIILTKSRLNESSPFLSWICFSLCKYDVDSPIHPFFVALLLELFGGNPLTFRLFGVSILCWQHSG
jgi:hypothetical protein